jgi:hypothetical protein
LETETVTTPTQTPGLTDKAWREYLYYSRRLAETDPEDRHSRRELSRKMARALSGCTVEQFVAIMCG